MLLNTFISEEEEQLVLQNWAPKIRSEIIAVEGRLNQRFTFRIDFRIEEITGIQGVVSKELKQLAVVCVGSRTSGQIHDGPSISSVLSRKRRVVNFVFCKSVDRRLERNLVLNVVIQIDAVDEPVSSVFPLSRSVDSERSLSAKRGREKTVCRRRHRARREQTEIRKVAAVQRNFLNSLVVDDLAHAICRGFDN